MSLLDVQNLSMSIAGTPILRDVSFQIAPGERFALVGESGSGKTMTALSAIGLLPSVAETTGRVMLSGRDLMAQSEAQLCDIRGRDIGMIFQEPMTALNPMHRIGDQVAETLLTHRAATRAEARDVALDRLARVGLPPDRYDPARYPHELSGGQRQRVSIAMAIALRPRLLIADEPTTALDVTTQATILDLLKDLVADEGMALMLITHDLAVVANMADRVAVMQHGQIVEDGPTEPLFRARSHAYTRKLFAASTHQPNRTSQRQPEPLLRVETVSRDYPLPRKSLLGPRPVFRAVDGVSLEVAEGESLGLVGESGCGKSTLVRSVLGLDAVQEGRITLGGAPVVAGEVPNALRQNMQVVFQDPFASFNPRHKVWRLVAEPFHLRTPVPDDPRAEVAEALRSVGLSPEDGEKYIHEFSGGQRQRIAIARAIINRPKLVVLDEAVSALDVSVRAQVLDLLAELQARYGLAYLFVSHDLSVVWRVTDRVAIMQKGRIVETGPTEAVFDAPANPYSQALLKAVPEIPVAWV